MADAPAGGRGDRHGAKHLSGLGRLLRRLTTSSAVKRGTPVAVVDIGTSKLCCYVVRARPGRGVQLLGRGYQLAEGLRAGEVVDADAAETSILATLHDAEQQAGVSVREAVISMSGGDPLSTFHHVAQPLVGRPVTDADLDGLLLRARRAAADTQRVVLHAFPLEASLDGGRPVTDPRGLSGQQLDLLVHVLSVRSTALRNLLACFERCHLEVRAVFAASYAAGAACLAPEEKERGCLLIDLGGGTTDIAHFVNGRLALVGQVAMGGEHVTHDVAYRLSTTRQHAERIKNLFGGVVWRACDDSTRIEVPLLDDHVDLPTGEIPRTMITQIARARVERIMNLCQEQLRPQFSFLRARPPRSIVLTGGTSHLDGIDELVQEMFGLPTRRGRPAVTHANDRFDDEPCCAAASGALQLLLDREVDPSSLSGEPPGPPTLGRRLNRWIGESF